MKIFLIIWASIGAISFICIMMSLLRSKLKPKIVTITQDSVFFLILLIASIMLGATVSAAIFYEVRYRMTGVDWPRDLFED